MHDGVAARIDAALEAFRAGSFVVLSGERGGSDEGHLLMAAERVTQESVAFMAREGRGIVCVALTAERCDELGLVAPRGGAPSAYATSVRVTIEARDGVTTGISAGDRARTIRVAADPASTARDLVQPGHIVPLAAREGGVLRRAGRAEAAVDLARLAGLVPAASVCEILGDDGNVASGPALKEYCERHRLVSVSINDLVAHRWRSDSLIRELTRVRLPTLYGEFTAVAYSEEPSRSTHLALVRGDVANQTDVLVRVHSACTSGDLFHSVACDCRAELETALRLLSEESLGVFLYLNRQRHSSDLGEPSEDSTGGADVVLGEAPQASEYGIGAQILANLGLSSIRVLTNNPKPLEVVEGFGLTVTAQLPLPVEPLARDATGAPSS